ncbi:MULTISPECIES: vanadium-dependent haloperoxidase [Dyadobacter]|uniref:Vanadium-dependent haloperoxidase n=1 Tax=Dyadobacter chenhuakuii TaxID=2909339 RepID=A0ABY4XFK9_9BACT|nr:MULTISPECIES: vanadium-dependent haloperoxidase [Dyadobacter]MCF2491940.1 vanadium-dependent haloperoxidase [Dyadobacter chenhuakuii]MCF2516577.1 vanadium-dependent haloperoxidase [Dyadobacter sp. CY351]USJ28898.1 vanadium-dependent haloperoxidase [Dyadobacter chenhuakuii]
MKFRLLSLICMSFAFGCTKNVSPDEYNAKAADPKIFHETATHLTDVIIHDIFKPPVASRIYSYSFLAAYEALVPAYPEYQSLGGQLVKFTSPQKPDSSLAYCYPLASIKAFATVGRTLTFSGNMWDDYEKDLFQKYRDMGIPDDVFERSTAYGDSVAKHVLAYSAKDHYKEIRGYRYTVTNAPGTWVPTPPAYADACEPMWNTVRTFALDSVTQFRCPPPAKYDLDKKSKFMELAMEVYNIGKTITEEQKATAYFWDDNAFVTNVVGHAMFANKKMTPAGHWLAIIRTVATDKKLDLMRSTEAYTLGALSLFDAFSACWDEKYRTVRIRPETVINNNWDPNWRPFLETPAFPEYVSGHSAISAACGTVLTHLIGDNVAFTDTTEKKYGHGIKSFKSFEEAYWDASISRVYGGIHYRDGVEQGTYLGQKVGENVWKRAVTKKGRHEIAAK